MSNDKIEILSLDLFEKLKDEMNIVETIQKYFNIGIGWHYYLDLAWMISIVKDLPKGSLLLDAGAGSGLSQFILSELGFNVISVDFANRQFPRHVLKRYEPIIHYINDQSIVYDNVYTRHLESTYRLRLDGKKTKGSYPDNPESVKQFIEHHRLKPIEPSKEKTGGVLKENPIHNCGRIFIYKSDIKNMFLIPNNLVDGVISISALEHNDHNGFEQCINELLRVTKQDGSLAVTVSASLRDDWYHEPSKGWCYSEKTIKRLFNLDDNVESNFSQINVFFDKFKKENNELHKRLAPFYYKSGENGMPWGKWDPKYLPVGVVKNNHVKATTDLNKIEKNLVSIIMPNYNYGAYIGEAIESIIAQTYKNWELIIVDDGSTDNSIEVIEKYKKKEPQKIITIYKNNGGQASAFNAGFSRSKGEIICFLDSDDYWFPNKLERILKEHKNYDFVIHNLMKGDKLYRTFEHYENHFELMTKHGLFDFFVPTSGLTFKRHVLKQIFPIPEPELKICADAYLTRMALYFSTLKIIDEPLGYYRVHSTNKFFNNLQNKQPGIIYDILNLVNKSVEKLGKPIIPFKPPTKLKNVTKLPHSTQIKGKQISDNVQVSIIIPTYNRFDFIIKTLKSVEELNYPKENYEVIIVDDGSTDGTKDYMISYSETTGLNFSYIYQNNSGPATARNVGWKNAKGKFIAFTDSDCIVDKNWLNELINGFTSEIIAGVGGSAQGVGNDIFSRYFAQTGMYSTRLINGTVTYLLTLNACYRKDILQKFNGFNEGFKQPGGEDPDLSFRIRKKGYQLNYNPNAIVYHHHKSNFISFIKTFRNYGKGQALLVKLHPEWYIKENIKKSYLGIIAKRFYLMCRNKRISQKDSLVLSILRYIQDFILYGNMYIQMMRMKGVNIKPILWENNVTQNDVNINAGSQTNKQKSISEKPEHMNVVINFHKGDQYSAKLLLEILMAVDEGISCTYYLQYGNEPATIEISDTILKFINRKHSYFSCDLPDIKIPEDLIKNDPNLMQYPEISKLSPHKNHWWQSRGRKLKVLQWNLCVYKYINKLESFLMLEPDSVILKNNWLKDIYERWKNYDGPMFGHLKKGKINGKYIPTHWAGSSVYDCKKLRELPLEKYFYERYQNPWWRYINEQDTSLMNNCFWGPMFSGYDISYDYFLFGLYWKKKTGSNNPSDWPLETLISHEDLILCDWDSKMRPSDILNKYYGKIALFHGIKDDEIREIVLKKFLSNNDSISNNMIRGGMDFIGNKYFSIKDLKNRYVGERCFIIGNGPSLKETDLRLLKNEYTIGLNRIYLNYDNMGFIPSFYCSVNPNVIEQFGSEIDKLNTIKFLRKDSANYIKNKWNTFFMKSLDPTGFDFNKNLETLEWYEGGTVTYCAMQVAYYLGFTTVILIGVDHYFKLAGEPNKLVTAQTEDPNHFHPNYFGKGVKWQYPDLARSEQAYKIAKRVFEEDGRIILDATIGGHLKVFPKVNYLSILKEKTITTPSVDILIKKDKPQFVESKSFSVSDINAEQLPYKYNNRIEKLQTWLQLVRTSIEG